MRMRGGAGSAAGSSVAMGVLLFTAMSWNKKKKRREGGEIDMIS